MHVFCSYRQYGYLFKFLTSAFTGRQGACRPWRRFCEKIIMFKDIYFINLHELSNRLKKNEISDFIALKHFIGFLVIFNTAYVFPFLTIPAPNHPTVVSILYYISAGAINAFGLLWLFQLNEKAGGKNFFKRFVCLSLPASIRATVFVLLPYVAILILIPSIRRLSNSVDEHSIASELFLYLIEIAFLIVFYNLMSKCFRVSSSHT